VELVRDRLAKTPADTETTAVHQLLREEGVLVGHSGFYKNVLRICPPLIITPEDGEFLVAALERAFARYAG
ncbi:MAG TPA: aspartate aminotransferase family protein, partial [Bordetella sp.]|nr:aspartate aminotransferase family protein [Bordetella sp.]